MDGALRRGESDAALLERLRLPAEAGPRRERLIELWEPAAVFALPEPGSPEADPETIRARARAVRDGRQILFGREVRVGWPPRWDWRWDGTPEAALFAADVRSTWEVQRLQGILPLARAARVLEGAEAEAFAADYVAALMDFFRHHPGPAGTAWASALELGLRLVALAQGLPLVAATEAFAASDLALLKLVDRHARRLAADLSLDKVVRGNHLLGELAGLVAAGHLVPGARDRWWGPHPAQAVLEAEILRQFHPDGVNVEQSLTYEKFILEFLAVAGRLAALRGAALADPVAHRMLAAAAHLEAATLPGGDLPRVGDCDSGRGADWGEADPHRAGALVERLRAWFPGPGASPVPEAPEADPALRLFPSGGHAILRTAGGGYLFLRGGPFGWGVPGPCSHSHADWLSPVLALDGTPVLVDPGVGGYRVAPGLRDGFRTWSAHNGPGFHPPRPPRPAGTFRWRGLEGVSARLDGGLTGDGAEIRGEVRWEGGREPLLWSRSIRYNQLDRTWLILDRVSETTPEPVTWALHFAPDIRLEPGPDPGVVIVTLPSGRRWSWAWDPAGEIAIEEGRTAPAYGSLVTAPVLHRRLGTPGASRLLITPIP